MTVEELILRKMYSQTILDFVDFVQNSFEATCKLFQVVKTYFLSKTLINIYIFIYIYMYI